MTAIAFENIELIPGYTAIERIGSGGYGEVWRVEAPGGLEKAIKIVHGYHDDERARRELKALERIRRVRHPFLLSVERAEIVDGRLAILTELAEMSLEQRFEQYSIEGLCGIPRDELLGYLRDAADALDYLLQQHQLQHLDIKPENLLLAAGHVKVADFGLVKSVSDSAQHVIGEGLTPMYAAPEVFDGQASPYSDQYSLAIVFHEMLTGALPFPGRTTAQLALQHAQFPPMLQALPVSDREVVAKALAKSPVGRFKSCCEFVEALIGRRPAGVAASTRASEGVGSTDGENLHPDEPPAKRARETDACAAAAPGEARADATMRMEQQACIRVRSDIVNAIVPDVDAQDAGFRPTLYVGIGEVGTRTLCGLRERLDRELPRNWSRVVQMVAVDTDRSTLQAAECGLWGGRLAQDETLWLGLRRAQQYRSDSPSQLRWLSRRWLYNIPQSLLTRGLRPLGRLALVDHAENLLRTLRERLKTFDDSKRIQEFMDRWGIPCRNRRPRVVLIASTNGGTGGGMVVDLAFALQHISAQLGWQEVEILGLLTHLTGSQKKQNDRALANAYSMLSELVTIQSHGYRGKREPSASTAAFEGDQLPFSSMYFVHLGDNLGEHQMEEALAGLADYLSVDATTTAGAALDGIRMRDQKHAVTCQPTFGSAH